MPRKLTKYDIKRLAKRDSIWEDAREVIWNRREETGFITIPRTLSMILTLIKVFAEKNDPSRVYFELWCRQRDDGYVEIDDPDELAQSAGFYRGRRVRSLREALDRLHDLGLIRIAGKGQRKYAFILILHPHNVVQELHHREPNRIPPWWWELFRLRVQDIGTQLRWKPPALPKTQGAPGDAEVVDDDEGDDLPF